MRDESGQPRGESREADRGRPVVLNVAGSDSAGMAGIQMDSRTQHALGVHAAAAVTANTAQHCQSVLAINPVPAAQLRAQLRAAMHLAPRVIKAGLLAFPGQVQVLCEAVDESALPLVYDPVQMSSASGVLQSQALSGQVLDRLLSRCHLLTPNLAEAQSLTGLPVGSAAEIETLARYLVEEKGVHAVLIKGGHGPGALARDYFCSRERTFWLSSARLAAANTRGTGCALASAIAAALARNYALADAVVIGKMAINQGLRQGYACAASPGPVHISGFPDEGRDLPWLHEHAGWQQAPAFPDCGARPLGLYPIVDRASWLERLLPLGVNTVQLRIKDLTGEALSREIGSAVSLARQYKARLFINDHWQLALRHGAYGVHLGQEDVAHADLQALREAGLRLGLSTHCHYEVAAAHAWRPSYLACGPIFPTSSKDMPWIPHDLSGLGYWRRVLAGYPLVAIGGINQTTIAPVAHTAVDGIALISAITQAADPEASTRELLQTMSMTVPKPR